MDGRGQNQIGGMRAAELLQAAPEGVFSPPVGPKLAERLQRFRMRTNLSCRFLAQRITGIHLTPVRRVARGARICDPVAFRIERFLVGVERVL